MAEYEFHGADYRPEYDYKRLSNQIDRIKAYCLPREWLLVQQIARACKAPENSVQAQLRNLRKKANGAYIVERRKHPITAGLYEFKVRLRTPEDEPLKKSKNEIIEELNEKVRKLLEENSMLKSRLRRYEYNP